LAEPTSVENLRIYIPEVIGVQELIRELKDTEPELVKQMRKDLITEIKPLYGMIKSNIPTTAPLSGFSHYGRTGWKKNPVKVTGKAVTSSRGGKTNLVSIRTTSAAVEIADMAGRKANGNTEQGQAMIANLRARFGGASRFVYPAIEKEIPKVRQSLVKIIERYAEVKSRKILVNPPFKEI
jgi:septum formation topological specificity factor MinE